MKFFTFVLAVVALLFVSASANAQNGRSVRGESCETMYNACCDNGAAVAICFTYNVVVAQDGSIEMMTAHGTGVGASGQKYVFTCSEFTRSIANENNDAATYGYTLKLRFNAPGTDCDFTARMTVRLTVNANGEVTVEFSDESAECENGLLE